MFVENKNAEVLI